LPNLGSGMGPPAPDRIGPKLGHQHLKKGPYSALWYCISHCETPSLFRIMGCHSTLWYPRPAPKYYSDVHTHTVSVVTKGRRHCGILEGLAHCAVMGSSTSAHWCQALSYNHTASVGMWGRDSMTMLAVWLCGRCACEGCRLRWSEKPARTRAVAHPANKPIPPKRIRSIHTPRSHSSSPVHYLIDDRLTTSSPLIE
jgi:hypothetical protein